MSVKLTKNISIWGGYRVKRGDETVAHIYNGVLEECEGFSLGHYEKIHISRWIYNNPFTVARTDDYITLSLRGNIYTYFRETFNCFVEVESGIREVFFYTNKENPHGFWEVSLVRADYDNEEVATFLENSHGIWRDWK